AARPRADIAQDHERGRLLRVALHPVWAAGIVADRFQPQFLQQPSGEVVGVAFGDVALEPARKAPRNRGCRRRLLSPKFRHTTLSGLTPAARRLTPAARREVRARWQLDDRQFTRHGWRFALGGR